MKIKNNVPATSTHSHGDKSVFIFPYNKRVFTIHSYDNDNLLVTAFIYRLRESDIRFSN